MAYEAGEFFPGARVQRVTASADIAKGAVVTITPAHHLPQRPVLKTVSGRSRSRSRPWRTARPAASSRRAKSQLTVPRTVYTGAVVTGSGGKVKVCDTDPSGNYIKPLGRMTVGGADTAVGVVDLGGF